MLSMFFGATADARITAQVVTVQAIRTGPATAGVSFQSDGKQVTIRNSSNTVIGDWVTPAFSANEWEIRATLESGTTPVGTMNTWLPLTSTRSWTLDLTTPGVDSCFLTFEFRKVGGPTVATITSNSLTVEVLDIFQ